ncbi:flagellar assembly protein T N-terminal domain-containing protein [Psychrobium sp. 1_MG-2023]|uniref:flagellar assembly protein T N-terminal domain-containing protein n=1 Tax=Psychrobium sp. 1_MG-2023 TaxID=3062624 RepID=UPI000C33F64C|nr:flagellar assembly protein T N-terminal domain-containing protein [Psychrobium sp. 1_MG-2023]MDP2559880.1 flagellar assembly protein T N-terminal domain-containing protein [Psychrobium sp. 1_MG-2023]PKF59019.1 hypothetical protein CW748_02185 [Alteromonadales bacterium alter-6D02]
MTKFNLMSFILLNISLLVFSPTVKSEWFEAHGQAPIINSNLDVARQQAVEDALRHALLFNGAQIQSVSKLSQGLLMSDHFEVRSQGSVRDLKLINETQAPDYVKVTIRADIVADPLQCDTAQHTKTLALTQFPILNRQQAVNGSVFDLGKHTSMQLFDKMSLHKGSYLAKQLLPIEQLISSRDQPFTTNEQQLLTQQADSQYLLTGQIDDISLFQAESKWFGLSNNAPKRQFSLTMTLFHGLSGERIWSKKYQTIAPWKYKPQQTVDVSSQAFWYSEYGVAINNQLTQAVSDINQRLFCEELTGEVLKVEPEQLTINLGTMHGLKLGDKLTAFHRQTFTDSNGILRQSTTINSTVLVVKNINRNHLTAAAEQVLYGDIQLGDLIRKQ